MTCLAYALLAAATSIAPGEPLALAQLSIQRRVVIRVPARATVPPPERRIKWKETKGPKCVPMGALAGAAITGPDRVDLFLRGGARLRAELDDECPAIDFYSGFYVRPTADGRMCADRDMIHSRGGAECGIERFRTLVPEK